jgi:hypothetical protein
MIPKQEAPILVEDDGQISIDDSEAAGERSEDEE